MTEVTSPVSASQLRALDWHRESPAGFEQLMVLGPAAADLIE